MKTIQNIDRSTRSRIASNMRDHLTKLIAAHHNAGVRNCASRYDVQKDLNDEKIETIWLWCMLSPRKHHNICRAAFSVPMA